MDNKNDPRKIVIDVPTFTKQEYEAMERFIKRWVQDAKNGTLAAMLGRDPFGESPIISDDPVIRDNDDENLKR